MYLYRHANHGKMCGCMDTSLTTKLILTHNTTGYIFGHPIVDTMYVRSNKMSTLSNLGLFNN